MGMMRILSSDAAGSASRMSPGGGSAMSSYEQMVQIDGWQRQWRRYANNRSENQKNILDAFAQFVYSIDNGYDIFDAQENVIRTILDEQVVQGVPQSNGSNGDRGLSSGDWGNILTGGGYLASGLGTKIDAIVKRNYSGYNPKSVIKTGKYLPYNIRVSTNALQNTSSTLKTVGNAAGLMSVLHHTNI